MTSYDVILGLPILRKHNYILRFSYLFSDDIIANEASIIDSHTHMAPSVVYCLHDTDVSSSLMTIHEERNIVETPVGTIKSMWDLLTKVDPADEHLDDL